MPTIRIIALVALTLAVAAPAAAADGSGLIVLYEDGLAAADRADVRRDAEVVLVDRLTADTSPPIVLVEPRSGQTLAEALAELRADPRVAAVAPDEVVVRNSLASPTDTFWADSSFWGVRKIKANDAWPGRTFGEIAIAIADSGMQLDHPDLAPRLRENTGEVAGNGIDDDGNGYVDDRRGWDWVQDDADPSDVDGHGTSVAGTAAAAVDNGVGIAGVAPNATIVPLRVLGDTGTGLTSDIIAALDYAGDNGIRVVNASLGTANPSLATQNLYQTTVAAHPNTLFIFTAGNGGDDLIGDDNDAMPYAPCTTPGDNVICVAATTSSDALASFSNFGATSVDLGAPGNLVLTTGRTATASWSGTPGYRRVNGTSFAAPHVAGAAALALGVNSSLSAADLRRVLLDSGDVVAGLSGKAVSGRRLNALNAVVTAAGLPRSTAGPQIAAAATTVGSTLGATPGTWADSTSVARQWLRDGSPITGAIGSTYAVTVADAGSLLSLRETATNASGTNSATSDAVRVAPHATTAPGISRLGTTLFATAGTWQGATSATTAYRWLRDGAPVAGITGNALTISSADVGRSVVVEVTRAIGVASSTSTSAATVVDAAWFPVPAGQGSGAADGSPAAGQGEDPFAVTVFTALRGVTTRPADARKTGRIAVSVSASGPGVRTTVEVRQGNVLLGRATATVGTGAKVVVVRLNQRGKATLARQPRPTLQIVAIGIDAFGEAVDERRTVLKLR